MTSKEYMREYRKKNPKYYQKGLIRNRLLRLELMDILGGRRCSDCCYEDVRALQIDHIHGGGTQERKAFGSQMNMWRFYYKNPKLARKRLRVLCANCNQIKQHEQQEFSWMEKSNG